MKTNNLTVGIWTMLLFCGCSNFLEEKPDIKMVIPKTLNDAELLLNNYSAMNTGYPLFGEWGADEYYLTDENFDGALNFEQQNTYSWLDEPNNDIMQWQRPYKVVYNANQVLEIIDNLGTIGSDKKSKNLSGIAHFYRAFAFQQMLEVFAPAYQAGTAMTDLGIPLRLDPGIDEPSTRASVQQSFDQVIKDYKTAVWQLPLQEAIKGRPFRASAYAGLARTYLYMGNYQQAYLYADSSLHIHANLMDFNTLNASADLPIDRFNVEVLFAAITGTSGPMSLNNGLVDSTLYRSYADNDLRKTLFFRKNLFPQNTYGFKGNYDKALATIFVGLTSSEMYLVKAEAAARIGKVTEALSTLNTLLKKRQDENQFIPVTEMSPNLLLPLILKERQKELVFRGRRWSDLKRLNLDPRFQKTLKKVVKGKEYTLSPNSIKYAFRLPEPVVIIGKIPQNLR
ncbi:hypothetical protein KO02_10080 [Sphingobacterium sp. ML3W]|uniref:RagB/SusD family nutrient uptake outer membrane protein n=1 Tax=Sphingobacterium sp. ML3W TaxID=1538644 RepID=UPI0004F8E711|nr:RagB/SusD family nutrient uptake outer membrane protein [Sphingobacterium sp. ML3W]AIM37002.1 hypothetical protein KO02_10080 [Sphingobacterium sp. ML3W]